MGPAGPGEVHGSRATPLPLDGRRRLLGSGDPIVEPPLSTAPVPADRSVRSDGGAFRAGALLLGVGLGGLADGIVFHQILQWHHLVAERVPPTTLEALRTNVLWDGLFHVATTVTLVVGFVLLQRSWQRADRAAGDGRAIAGWVLIGWGVFHVVDQVVFHELLDLHDIRMGVADPGVYNWTYGASGLVLIGSGLLLLRRRHADRDAGSAPGAGDVTNR